jgi:hypothetical protein
LLGPRTFGRSCCAQLKRGKPETAIRILTRTTVSVANHDGMAEVTFDSGRIGNFTFLHFTIIKASIEALAGGHRMDGEVQGDAGETIPVRLVTVAGSSVDSALSPSSWAGPANASVWTRSSCCRSVQRYCTKSLNRATAKASWPRILFN